MVDSVRIDVQERTEDGTAACRRIRRAGRVPAVLYGLGRGNRKLTMVGQQIISLADKGVQIVELTLGDKTQVALIKDLQFDSAGKNVLHVDLLRINRETPVHVWIPVRFIGTAPAQAGSIVERIREEIQVEVLPLEMPAEFTVNLSTLQVGQHVSIGDLRLPAGCKPYHCSDTDTVVVNHILHVKADVVEGAETTVEPEVIGAKKTDEAAPAGADDKKDKKK